MKELPSVRRSSLSCQDQATQSNRLVMYGCVGLASWNPPSHVPRSKCDGASSERESGRSWERVSRGRGGWKEGENSTAVPRSSEMERGTKHRGGRLEWRHCSTLEYWHSQETQGNQIKLYQSVQLFKLCAPHICYRWARVTRKSEVEPRADSLQRRIAQSVASLAGVEEERTIQRPGTTTGTGTQLHLDRRRKIVSGRISQRRVAMLIWCPHWRGYT